VTLTELSVGDTYNLGLDTSGKLWAWGFNGDGQLGNGTTDHSSKLMPVDLPSNITVESFSAGRRHNLAIASDGSVWAWGNNNFGAIGNGNFDADETTPVMVQVPSGEQFQMISAGLDYSMAISGNDEIWGWGFNNDGQIGDSTRTDRYLPVKINFTAE
jgi:alpha-tubulin suppressor-like RCC1 family protein